MAPKCAVLSFIPSLVTKYIGHEVGRVTQPC